jgi:D-alanyl-D-alanine carboxypeptidase
MFRHNSMSFLKRDPRLTRRVLPKPLTHVLLAVLGLTFVASQAEARRHYYRHHASGYASAAAAMAIDLHTGRILYSKNVDEPRYPASITKVMTLYLLFDALRDGKIAMTTKLRVSAHAADQSPTKLDLSEGDTISVADAIGAIVTKSANDMAVAVAEALAGSEEEFARRMTQKARTIGMLHTTFRNASGLPNSEQVTTAQDLIVLGKSILVDHPERCKVFATKYFQYDGQVFRNHNTLLFSYAGMEGMKTGFTSAAGFNLIATARRSDKRLLAVVLGGVSASSRNAAMRNILDNAWPKAMTQMAARKAGMTIAAAAPKPAAEPPASKPAQPAPQPVKQAAAAIAPGPAGFTGSYSRLKRRPDRQSISILLGSIEEGLVSRPRANAAASAKPAQSASDMTTDEPEDKAERAEERSAAYVPPPPQDIVRNETLAAMTAPAPAHHNVSVHYKTVRQPDVTPLAAAALDPEPAPAKPVRLVSAAESAQGAQLKAVQQAGVAGTPAAPPQTLAAATAEESRSMDQPGPFHVQVGAFADQEQARERLHSVRETLGAAMLKAHPEFIMPVSLPSGVTMFRARLSRFSDEAQAKATCKRLKKSGIECWDIRAD